MASLFNNSLAKRVWIAVQDPEKGYAPKLQDGVVEIVLDATTQAEVQYSNEITNFYVSSGTDNTDHMRTQPREISFSGVISNEQGLVDFIQAGGYSSKNDSAAAQKYHETIKTAVEEKALFTVSIPNVGTIFNCGVTSATFSTDSQHYNAFKVRMAFKEIRLPKDITEVATVEVADQVAKESQQSATPPTEESVSGEFDAGDRDNPVNVPSQNPTVESFTKGVSSLSLL
jgi:hypothetical protein